MSKNRRNFTAEQKAAIVKRHLKDKVAVSDLANEFSIQPTQLNRWVALALDQLEKLFVNKKAGPKPAKNAELKQAQLQQQQIERLQQKLTNKNEVIAELMEENVKAKKANGDL